MLVALAVSHWFIPVSGWYYGALVTIYIGIQTYGSMVVSSQIFIPTTCRGDRKSNAVAITFDDGPLPLLTEKILEILRTFNAPAAFFCIGSRVQKNPEIVKKIHTEGHIIGNHSFLHGKFFDLQSPTKMIEELENTDKVIQEAIGARPRFFRPPYGVTNPNLSKAVRTCGHRTIGWNVRSLDTITADESRLFERVTKNLQGGDIVLFHDYCDSTINVLPKVLKYIADKGLNIVRLDELLNEKAYE